MNTFSWKTYVLVAIPGTLWGFSFILVDVILRELPTFTLTTIRSFISGFALLIVLYGMGGRLPPTWQDWRPHILLGIFNNALPFTLLTFGQTRIPSGLATILTSAMPLFTILLAHFYTDEKLNWMKGVGMLIGFGGIFVLVGPNALLGGGTFVGQMLIISATFCYAIGNIMIRGFFTRAAENPPASGNSGFLFLVEVATTQFIAAAIVLLPFSLLGDAPWLLRPSLGTWGAMVTLAVGNTVIAGLVYYYLIETAGSAVGATSVYLIPIAGVIGSAIFLGQAITVQAVVALAFVFAGISLVNRKSASRPA